MMAISTPPNKKLSFPALKSLSELADAQPIIQVDTREIYPLIFTKLQSITATLGEGDYGIAGVTDFVVERKGNLGELASCCVGENRTRFEKELRRMLSYKFKRLLIVGATCESDILTYPYRSSIRPQCVLGSLFAWQARFDIPYVLVPTPAMAARMLETWAQYWCVEIVQNANGLLRGYWRSAKAKIPTGGIDEPFDPDAPPEPPEGTFT